MNALRWAAMVAAFAVATAGWTQDTQPAKKETEKKTQSTWKDTGEELKVGEKAPAFVMAHPYKMEDREPVDLTLEDYKGEKNVLLAFYPKAFTGGCTRQLTGYTEDWDMFKDNDTEVIAISYDPQEQANAFKSKYGMPFMVLGDPDGNVIEKYHVPIRERSAGNVAKRVVVLIDKEGVVQFVDYDYKVGKDKEALYAEIKKLNEDKESDES